MALPKINNPRLEDELSILSEFVDSNLKDYIVNKYQKNMARVLLEFYDYDLQSILRDIVDADSLCCEIAPEDSERRKHIIKSMNKGILDTFDGSILPLIKIIGVCFDEEKGTNMQGE